MGPTGYGDSPYQSFSTFAGNPYYISLDALAEEGLLTAEEIAAADLEDEGNYVNYEKQYNQRFPLLRKAFDRSNIAENEEFQALFWDDLEWLPDYCLIMAIKDTRKVAGFLTMFKLDCASGIGGLLLDTVEDTDTTVEEVRQLFGDQVASLVDGLTKLAMIEQKSTYTKQAENFRKLLLAMSEDIRVLLIKLADRLHNMRTLHFLAPEKRTRIARETLDIYAPLAERIGMQEVKS